MPKHFCCCFSLKTGAIIMSFLNLLEGGIETIAAIIELSDLESKEEFEKLKRSVDVVEKVCNVTIGIVCNMTKLCNETALAKKPPSEEPGLEGNITLFTVCLIVGLVSLFNGILLLLGLLQAKEKYVLLYVLTGSITLFIVTIYTGIYMFSNALLLLFFVLSLFMCYGQLAMYHFFEEVSEYNTVKSGVIEIAYNGDAKSFANSGIPANESVDNTSV